MLKNVDLFGFEVPEVVPPVKKELQKVNKYENEYKPEFENQKITTGYNLKFKGNGIVQTEVKEWIGENQSKISEKQMNNLKDNKTKGVMSKRSKQKLKESVNWLVVAAEKKNLKSLKFNQVVKFKINFITLTIPPQLDNMIEEKKFKTILNTWLTYHRKFSNLNNYVWKIEKHKDGRLHIHILTDTFIHYKNVRDSWNLILKRNGLLEFHFTKFNNYEPNSTDIHSIQKVKKVAAYVCKYMAKDNKEDLLYNGRVWSCSSKISVVVGNCLNVSPDKIGNVLKPIFQHVIDYIRIETPPDKFGRRFEVAMFYLINPSDWFKLKGSYLYDYFKELVIYLRNNKQIKIEFNLAEL
jgi:hypothetical protein